MIGISYRTKRFFQRTAIFLLALVLLSYLKMEMDLLLQILQQAKLLIWELKMLIIWGQLWHPHLLIHF